MSVKSEKLAELLSELRYIGETTDCHWTVLYVRHLLKKFGGGTE